MRPLLLLLLLLLLLPVLLHISHAFRLTSPLRGLQPRPTTRLGATTTPVPPTPSTRLQTLDYTTLVLLTRELKQTLLPGRVENVMMADDFSLLIQIRSLEALTWLLVCWQPEAARVCLQKDGLGGGRGGGGPGEKKKKRGRADTSSVYSLPGQLKGFLQLKTLINIATPLPGERILTFEFADRVTDIAPTHKLVVEIMGRRSNVILVDGEEQVLACGYQVSPSKSVRPVSVGQRYTLPPPLTMPLPPPLPDDPGEYEAYEAEFLRRITLVPSHPLPKALISAYRGFSPQLVETMAAAVDIPEAGTTPVGDVGDEALGRFFRGPVSQWIRLLVMQEAASLDANQGGMSRDGARYTPILFAGGEKAWRPMPSVLELVERYYTACLERQELRDLQRKGLSRVQAVFQRLQRTRQEFQRQLDSATDAQLAKLQTKADLLTTYAYSWKEGDETCTCLDFETGAEVVIPLKAGNTAADEAQSAYSRIRKLKRSIDVVLPLLQKIDVKMAYVEELESSIQQLGGCMEGAGLTRDLAVMREISEELGIDGPGGAGGGTTTFFSTILNKLSLPGAEPQEKSGGGGGEKKGTTKKPKGGGKAAGKKGGKGGNNGGATGGGATAPRMSIQSYLVPSSEEEGAAWSPLRVYVGRNGKQNDYVTFSLAKDHELWFHAQGVPGAHCLLRCDPGAEVGDKDMQFAADLAAFFSKARGAGQVPVLWTSPKNLKRIVGGGPGMVQVSKEKVLWGRPEEGEKIVRAQDEDE